MGHIMEFQLLPLVEFPWASVTCMRISDFIFFHARKNRQGRVYIGEPKNYLITIFHLDCTTNPYLLDLIRHRDSRDVFACSAFEVASVVCKFDGRFRIQTFRPLRTKSVIKIVIWSIYCNILTYMFLDVIFQMRLMDKSHVAMMANIRLNGSLQIVSFYVMVKRILGSKTGIALA